MKVEMKREEKRYVYSFDEFKEKLEIPKDVNIIITDFNGDKKEVRLTTQKETESESIE